MDDFCQPAGLAIGALLATVDCDSKAHRCLTTCGEKISVDLIDAWGGSLLPYQVLATLSVNGTIRVGVMVDRARIGRVECSAVYGPTAGTSSRRMVPVDG